jgi:hypothetical protein
MTSSLDRIGRWTGTLAAAVVGGIAARFIVGSPPLAVTIPLSLVVGLAIGTAAELLGRRAATRERRTSQAGPARPDRRPEAAATKPETSKAFDGWIRQQGAAPAIRPERLPSLPPPLPPEPLARFLTRNGGGWEPQCPRCGSFAPASSRTTHSSYRFACRRCEHTWEWSDGQPWPAVRLDLRFNRSNPTRPQDQGE